MRVVEGDDEEVGALERLEHRAPVCPPGERVAGRPGQLVEHRGGQKEGSDVVGLGVEHLLEQVVEGEPVAGGERVDEPVDAGPVRGTAACREAASCRPAAHPSVRGLQGGDVRLVETERHDVVEEPARLVGREPQVGRADLDQLAPGAQSRQRQRRVGPGRHGQGDLRGEVVEQERDGLVDARGSSMRW